MTTQPGAIDRGIDQALEQVATFVTWWRDELAGLLPRKARASLLSKPGSRLELTRSLLDGTFDREEGSLIGIVPETDLFRIRKFFPKAVRKDLREVIALQIEQLVPVERNAIEFDFRICGSGVDTDQIEVEIVILEKERLEAMTAWAVQNDVPLEAICSLEEHGGDVLFTHFEGALLRQRRNARRINALLLVLLAILGVSASSAVAARWQSVEASWADLVKLEQSRAVDARALKESVRMSEATELARSELRSAGDLRQAVALMTELLPDHTFTRRMEIKGDVIILSVVSHDLADLRAVLQSDTRLQDVSLEADEPGEANNAATLTARLKR